MRRQEELIESIDAAIEGGYLKAPEVVALCQASPPRSFSTAKSHGHPSNPFSRLYYCFCFVCVLASVTIPLAASAIAHGNVT